MTRTTRRASPMPATTGPTTQTRLVREGWDGMRSQSTCRAVIMVIVVVMVMVMVIVMVRKLVVI